MLRYYKVAMATEQRKSENFYKKGINRLSFFLLIPIYFAEKKTVSKFDSQICHSHILQHQSKRFSEHEDPSFGYF